MGSSLPESPVHGIGGATPSAEAPSDSSSPNSSPPGSAPSPVTGVVAAPRGVRAELRQRLLRSKPGPGWRVGHMLYRLALTGAGLVALAVGVQATFAGFYRSISVYDEGVLLTNAHLLLRGKLPYEDFYTNYPPGIFGLLAGLFALFGQSVAIERWLGMALHLAVATLAGRVAGRALGERFSVVVCGIVACWLAMLGMPAYAWLAAFSLALLACEVWAWAQGHGKPLGYVLAGATLGIISWFRHDLFMYFSAVLGGFGAAWIAVRRWRGQRAEFFSHGSPLHGVFHIAGGALGVVLLLWAPLFATAGVSRVAHDLYFDQVHHTMPARVLPLPPLAGLGPAQWSPVALPAFMRAPLPGAVLLTLLGPVAAVGALLWPRGAGLKDRRGMVCPAALAIAVLPQMLGRTDVYHSVFSVTPALIAIAVWLVGGPERRWSAGTAWGLLLPGVVALYLPLHDSFAAVKPPKPQAFRAEFARAGRTPMPPDRRRAVAFVRKHTGQNDPLYVGMADHRWTRMNDMSLYFLADRVGATRYMQFDPNLTNREDVQRSMIEELERTRPKVALLAHAKRSREPNESRNAGSSLLNEYMREHYVQKGRAGSLNLMLRRPETAPPASSPVPPSPVIAPSPPAERDER